MLYMVIWTPVVGEMLVVKIEPTNRHDIHAVVLAIAPSNGLNVYADKMKELVESLLADGHYGVCVIVTLLNDNWHF